MYKVADWSPQVDNIGEFQIEKTQQASDKKRSHSPNSKTLNSVTRIDSNSNQTSSYAAIPS